MEISLLSAQLNELKFEERSLIILEEGQLKSDYGLKYSRLELRYFSPLHQAQFGKTVFSENENHMVVSFEYERKGTGAHHVCVYDKNFRPIYNQQVERVVQGEDMDLLNFSYFSDKNLIVDDEDGSVYYIDKIDPNRGRIGIKRPKYYYDFFQVKDGGQKNLNRFIWNKPYKCLICHQLLLGHIL